MSASRVAAIARLGIATLGLTLASAAFGTHAWAQADNGSQKATTPPATGAPVGGTDKIAKGRDLFANWSCGSCHSLADAGATGHVGPEFDGDANLNEAFIVNRVTNGQGAMPAFGGQMSDEEIATIATYINTVAKKK